MICAPRALSAEEEGVPVGSNREEEGEGVEETEPSPNPNTPPPVGTGDTVRVALGNWDTECEGVGVRVEEGTPVRVYVGEESTERVR